MRQPQHIFQYVSTKKEAVQKVNDSLFVEKKGSFERYSTLFTSPTLSGRKAPDRSNFR